MTKFEYAAFDDTGEHVRGTISADNESDARHQLLMQNFAVRRIAAKVPLYKRSLGAKKVKPTEVLHFTTQLAAFVRSGMSIVAGINIIASSTSDKQFAGILSEVADQVREGIPLDEALAEHHKVLPPYYLGVVRSATMTGRLDTALEQLAKYMERELEARSKIKAALTYPVVVTLLAISAVVVLTMWVLPHFVVLFEDMGTELPWATRTLMWVSATLRSLWYVHLVVIGSTTVVYMWSRRSERGRLYRHRLLLKLPVAGQIARYAAVERVCRVLSTMWAAGVPVGDTMRAATQGANNAVFEQGLDLAAVAVLEGEGLAGPIGTTGMFPDAAIQMLIVGEETGTLGEQMENAANFYSRELDYKLKRLTTLFEPAIIVVVGVFIGFVALALVDAMYGSFQGVQDMVKL